MDASKYYNGRKKLLNEMNKLLIERLNVNKKIRKVNEEMRCLDKCLLVEK